MNTLIYQGNVQGHHVMKGKLNRLRRYYNFRAGIS
jgi:hypothetical protein